MQPVSRKVAVACGLTHYFTGKACHKGHINFRFTKTGHCLDCATERNRSAEKVDYRKHYKQSNYEKILAKNRALYAQSPEKYRSYNRRYQQEHADVLRPKNATRTMLRTASKQQRTPKWLSSDDLWLMEEAYALAALRTKVTGIAWDVDHIVPLRGKVVSGLHVPWNIQVLPAAINRSKGNKFDSQAIA